MALWHLLLLGEHVKPNETHKIEIGPARLQASFIHHGQTSCRHSEKQAIKGTQQGGWGFLAILIWMTFEVTKKHAFFEITSVFPILPADVPRPKTWHRNCIRL